MDLICVVVGGECLGGFFVMLIGLWWCDCYCGIVVVDVRVVDEVF